MGSVSSKTSGTEASPVGAGRSPNLQCDVEPSQACGEGTVGIDLGLATLAALSDGTTIDRQRITARFEPQLATAQRAGRKRRVQAIHAEMANARKDYLHRCSTAIARRYQHVIVGNVNAAGLARTPLAKSVLDAGWSAFRTMLRYKMAMRPRATYEEVDEKGSTQRCSECGAPGGPKGIAALGVREWVCGACGTLHDRDRNAAHNLLLSGQSAGLQLTESFAL
jgi:putative transposase